MQCCPYAKNMDDTRQRIIARCAKLTDPPDYFKGFGNVLPDLPGNIVMLQRNRQFRINRTPQPQQLLHRRYVLTVCLREGGLMCAAEQTCRIPEGGAGLIYPFQSHHYVVDQEHFFWLVITFDMIGQFLPDFMLRSFELSPFTLELAERLLGIYLEFHSGNPVSKTREALFQSLFYTFILELRCGKSREPERERESAPVRLHRIGLFEKINLHIDHRIADPELSVEGLCTQFGISPASLYALFQALVGCNPGEYIRALRIKRAIKLLNANEMLIAEVAEHSGFTSQAIFSRCFRKVIGCSPSEYTRSHRD